MYSGGQHELVNNHGFQCALVLGVVLIVDIEAAHEGSLRFAYDEKQLAVVMLDGGEIDAPVICARPWFD